MWNSSTNLPSKNVCATKPSHLIMIGDLEVRFLDIQNLIVNKQETGRLQDLADVEALEKLLKNQKGV